MHLLHDTVDAHTRAVSQALSRLGPDISCAAAMQHVFAIANQVTALLNGATDPDPSQHGMTTEEERASSSKPQVSKTCSEKVS